MKKGLAFLSVILMIVMCACVSRNGVSSGAEVLGGVSSKEIVSPQSAVPKPADSGMSDDEIITLAKDLTAKGNEVFWWYMDEGMFLDVDTSDGDYTKTIRPVGRFSTIAELKAATETVYSEQFCENILYPVGFNESQGDNIKFREIDGVLHINLNNGGMGWPYEMTERMAVKSNEPEKLIVTVVSKDIDSQEVSFDFSIVQENGGWKLDNWYDYGTPKHPTTSG